jgi:hypothetical protein
MRPVRPQLALAFVSEGAFRWPPSGASAWTKPSVTRLRAIISSARLIFVTSKRSVFAGPSWLG